MVSRMPKPHRQARGEPVARARRVTGSTPQQQNQVATAIKNAREMALLPYPSSGRAG
ncbi:hypothetical protein [Amycolatopsis sp. CA-128772]|uniref:hypothetical protein n=1 Tax=Amycolatopsis sp. CA-128772 TaxID=2073159 RepID=UPI003519E7EC